MHPGIHLSKRIDIPEQNRLFIFLCVLFTWYLSFLRLSSLYFEAFVVSRRQLRVRQRIWPRKVKRWYYWWRFRNRRVIRWCCSWYFFLGLMSLLMLNSMTGWVSVYGDICGTIKTSWARVFQGGSEFSVLISWNQSWISASWSWPQWCRSLQLGYFKKEKKEKIRILLP